MEISLIWFNLQISIFLWKLQLYCLVHMRISSIENKSQVPIFRIKVGVQTLFRSCLAHNGQHFEHFYIDFFVKKIFKILNKCSYIY